MGLRVTGDQSLPVRPYYVPQPRDFEGLGGQGVLSPRGEKRMGLRVTGDQSLPVRPYYVPQPRDFEGLGGQGVPYPGGVGCLGRVRFASGPFGNFKGCCRPDIRPVLRVGDQTSTHWIGINIGPLLT